MENTKIKNFMDLDAWKEGHQLAIGIYQLTLKFPKEEKFGLTSQLRRAGVSVTANIAEGFSRYYFKEKIKFYYISRGSLSEIQNLLLVARDISYINKNEFTQFFDHCDKVTAIINGLIRSSLNLIKK
jgi:four helix bundle protein